MTGIIQRVEKEKGVYCHLCPNLIFKTNMLSAKMQRELMNSGIFCLSIATA